MRLQAPRWRCWRLPSRKQSNMLPVRKRRSLSALPGRRQKPNRSRLWKHTEGFYHRGPEESGWAAKATWRQTWGGDTVTYWKGERGWGVDPWALSVRICCGLEAEVGELTLSDLYLVTGLTAEEEVSQALQTENGQLKEELKERGERAHAVLQAWTLENSPPVYGRSPRLINNMIVRRYSVLHQKSEVVTGMMHDLKQQLSQSTPMTNVSNMQK